MHDVEAEPLFAERAAGIDIAKAGIEVTIRVPSETLWGATTRAEHLTWSSTLSTRALSPHLSVHGPVVQLAGAPRAE
jgi:hypothetical protein